MDPYPTYATLRAERPLFFSRMMQSWIMSRHEDISRVLKDQRFLTVPPGQQKDLLGAKGFVGGQLEKVQSRWLLFIDPPDHTRLRGLVRKAFSPRRIEGLRKDVERQVDDLLDPLIDQGKMDVITDFAYPLPVNVICNLLGVPTEDSDLFHEWSISIANAIDPILSAEVVEEGNLAAQAFYEYFDDLVQLRRQDPKDDLISELVRVEAEGERLTVLEMISTAVLLLVAGHETTMNLIGNGLIALLENRDQMRALADDPSGIHTAVEEFLRFDPPVQMTARRPREDVTLDGVDIPEGAFMIMLLGSANRDESVFGDAGDLDVRRAENPHLAFSGGIHFCLGASLARLEAEVAFQRLLQVPKIELNGEPERRRTLNVRGLSKFPVTLQH